MITNDCQHSPVTDHAYLPSDCGAAVRNPVLSAASDTLLQPPLILFLTMMVFLTGNHQSIQLRIFETYR